MDQQFLQWKGSNLTFLQKTERGGELDKERSLCSFRPSVLMMNLPYISHSSAQNSSAASLAHNQSKKAATVSGNNNCPSSYSTLNREKFRNYFGFDDRP
mmetsp:Transcript_5258/g.6885  ORF Transcript_5258/g.6885 Transcript_5258/m.6885 type:complete len:99 (-) Transcript_5258:270-566(-)